MAVKIILSVILRATQAISTTATLSTVAYILQHPDQSNDLGLKYTIFVSVFCLAYLVAIFGLSIYRNGALLVPGGLLILELLSVFFWICAMVSLGAGLDGLNPSVMCNPGVYNWETKTHSTRPMHACHAGQAAFGLSVFIFVLFVCSSVWYSLGVVRIVRKSNSKSLWRTNGVTGCSLNRAWLVLLQRPVQGVGSNKFEMEEVDQPAARDIL